MSWEGWQSCSCLSDSLLYRLRDLVSFYRKTILIIRLSWKLQLAVFVDTGPPQMIKFTDDTFGQNYPPTPFTHIWTAFTLLTICAATLDLSDAQKNDKFHMMTSLSLLFYNI